VRPACTAWHRRAGCRAGTGRRRAGAGRWWRGWGRSRCRAATRRLPAGRHPRRERRPGRVPAATPWTCAQRRGRGSWRSTRASCCDHGASVFMRPRLDSRGGTFHGRGRAFERPLAQRHISSSGSRSYPPARFWPRRRGGHEPCLRAARQLRRRSSLSCVKSLLAHPDSAKIFRTPAAWTPGGNRVTRQAVARK